MESGPKPLRLPEPLKRVGRSFRDNPLFNNFLTMLIRPLVRRLPEPQRTAVKMHIPRVGLVSATLPNGKTLRLRSETPESILNAIFYSGWMGEEPEVLPLWTKYASQSEVIVDVGAHIGHLSIVAALTVPQAKVFAFEPLPRVADVLRKNAELNDVTIDIRQKALGRRAGVAPFYAGCEAIPSSSSLDETFMLKGGNAYEKSVVEVSTLDSEGILKGKTLLKMDTETTEADVVAGAKRFFERKPVVFVEVIDSGERLKAELKRVGFEYRPFLLTAGQAVEMPEIRRDKRWRNWLLLPA